MLATSLDLKTLCFKPEHMCFPYFGKVFDLNVLHGSSVPLDLSDEGFKELALDIS